MTVKVTDGAEIKLDKSGNVGSVRCPKCRAKYANPLFVNDYKKIDAGCELRMSRGRVEIWCKKCGMELVTVEL